DRFLLSPRIRLGVAMIVLLLLVVSAPDFSLSFVRLSGQSELLLLGPAAEAFTLLCLVGLLNAVNMADGKNGIVISLGLIWSAILILRLPPAFVPMMAATATALGVLLWFNMHNRLFLGDSGSYAISALFGTLAVYAYNHDFARIRADDIVLMFAIPVFDTVRLMIVRSLQRRSPFTGGRDHLHHYLYARVGWPRGLWIYVALVALPNAGALALPGTAPLWLAVSLLVYVLVLGRVQRPVPLTA
ncbi:MAG: undecaprenyl/decaprenyl-phosphate alpha-N-acetylglucosaminyl 1-phosphate transferase, partial [Hyphomicrobium sp.]|nr:undecaprenyl/decaprenyl-phosphate alpha-N-acetylglucosaminyl 1-phosphate transferase [Hyphomicrobium sp.]